MPHRTLTLSIFSLIACALVILSGSRALAQGPTCCGFDGSCYQPGIFGNCGGDTQVGTGVACSPSPCLGRCCNLTTGTCTLNVGGNGFGSSNCNGGNGGFALGATSCGGNPCPPTGGCCNGTAVCSLLTQFGCGSNFYQGNNTVCGASPCTGACCDLNAGSCSLVGFGQCAGGQYNGVGSVCTATLCNGACCSQITGGCSLTGPNGCTGTSTYVGLHSTCGAGVCAQPGACCAPATFGCTSEVLALCQASSGTFEGVGTVCSPTPCPEPASPTAFTYQGRLTGGPTSGAISTRFTLWNNLSSTALVNRVAGPVIVNPVILNASLFTAVVDFGSRLPVDLKTWLQVEVDTGSGFVSLTPRQLMTFAPLAGHAAAAAIAGTTSQTLCLGPGSFVALDSSKRVVNSWADGVFMGVASGDELVAPINLPPGAKIDLVKAYIYDSVTENLEFFMVAKFNSNGNSYNVGADFVVSGNSGYFSQTYTGGPTIDGQSAYSLRVFPTSGVGTGMWPGNSTLAVMNVVITWHMP